LKINDVFLREQIITYLGNKRRLLGFLDIEFEKIIASLNKKDIFVLDAFAGSGIVSRLLKRKTTMLHVNDWEGYSHVVNTCYLKNREISQISLIEESINYLNKNKLKQEYGKGFIEELYAPQDDIDIKLGERVFYTNKNAKIIDNIRRMIRDDVAKELEYFCLGPLLYVASVNNNTSGVFKGFHKNPKTNIGQFGGGNQNCLSRITKEIELPIPIYENADCEVDVYQKNIEDQFFEKYDYDFIYLDPPYNQHPYGSNYHILNLISSYEKPKEISLVAGIPKQWNRSNFNKKDLAILSLRKLINNLSCKYFILSYNEEGIIPIEEVKNILLKRGELEIKEKPYTVYRGGKIKNREKSVKELLFIVKSK
jgi:adenine-specific DNA-methyltransferase